MEGFVPAYMDNPPNPSLQTGSSAQPDQSQVSQASPSLALVLRFARGSGGCSLKLGFIRDPGDVRQCSTEGEQKQGTVSSGEEPSVSTVALDRRAGREE